MTNPNKNLIVVVLDRSGSMGHLREATLAGLNTFLDEQRKLPGETTLHLVQFDNEYLITHLFKPLSEVQPLTFEDYEPRGTTALLDAIGTTVNSVGEKLASLPEDERPSKVVFVIQTDGAENDSQRFTRPKVFEMITHQRTAYAWEFVFLGANQDAIEGGISLGIAGNNSITYGANVIATRAVFNSTARAVKSYVSGQSVSASYSSADRADAMQTDADWQAPLVTVVDDTPVSSDKDGN